MIKTNPCLLIKRHLSRDCLVHGSWTWKWTDIQAKVETHRFLPVQVLNVMWIRSFLEKWSSPHPLWELPDKRRAVGWTPSLARIISPGFGRGSRYEAAVDDHEDPGSQRQGRPAHVQTEGPVKEGAVEVGQRGAVQDQTYGDAQACRYKKNTPRNAKIYGIKMKYIHRNLKFLP